MSDADATQPLPVVPPAIQPQLQTAQNLGYHLQSNEHEATLLVRHLPEAIPQETLSRLFSHYGASSVRPCSHGRVRNCAFVDFKNEALASQAQKQLNGLRFLGKVLLVERACKSMKDKKSQEDENKKRSDLDSLIEDAAVGKHQREGFKLGSLLTSEPIAERLGVDYPFPPYLEYAYPPPDGNILTNIVNALIAVPRFYTQVLHLMNKMNIPAPFRVALPTPPLPTLVLASPVPPPPPPVATRTNMEDVSSSESEMESSDEEAPGEGRAKAKRIKREAIVGPAVDEDIGHEAVGLKRSALLPKEIPIIKKKNPVLQIKIAPKQIQNEQVGDAAQEESLKPDKEALHHEPYATVEELKRGKLPPEEILSLPMFKNYRAGNPSSVLYIKNLAKDVVADDFYFIFGSFFGSIDVAKSSLNVKLMQEGRMRGQAFVTFPSIELAHGALNLVNGYALKGKPIIIQFGRNPAASI
ncbi:U11/U12 small nuclear ribonucleoprotein 65 kDa protein [Coffea eugenioides]|uniref:U11/U12 small nuclear ribonucleoprotein 65 kDa protein-like n=1 Tax=Coffea arabica TaxID=13443 RepID=A0A6P6UMT7_COFAR|nr:U11/U12 small nuclear ribonucleoprotein 65 kDa protein-like [Coffea arabica]XP_027091788.1 U11/U12 small nuclear ribonucleoprotein 65 kDa protein-like [Coffea arabica]XP_027091789.1 U11/U12 small nuclear ribonucleoprotein 65 kDa protein-like [Coffea arabica]XP_027149705.1 U11/U12 small nuclear ribonucleoprotein 65 kDa protein [Coffea eugenioides]XP_027149706.1 U11/U12 small nuclear ribonucleoprotein 65 kDa protein [Coffea eugenioides]XP_027149707.1 U11/U12 small nuclear ribonucleoprotein 65